MALAAASKTVDCLKFAHSLHACFLLAGDLHLPIIYQVHRIRDGKSFATRKVEATQKGRCVFTLFASFQKEEEGFDHQEVAVPLVSDPEMLLSMEELRERRITDPRLPRTYRNKVATANFVPWPIDIRFCEPNTSTNQTKSPPSLRYWFRAKGKLSDDQALHRCVVAYASDLIFLQVSLNPHRKRGLKPTSTSLDHAMWFHRPFKADEWLLFVMESPTAFNARGFCSGQMFNQKGEGFNQQHMDPMESGVEHSGHIEPAQTALICGLPDDIAIFCLARVPRKYHASLKCVSTRWRGLVCSEEWHSYRQKHNLDETWIYAFCRDKFEQLCCYVLDPQAPRRCWKQIQVPPCSLKRKGMGFEVLGKKVYLLGGCGWVEDATNEVYCYDAATNAWNKAAPLSTPRCYFASEVLGGKIYAIGGLGSNSNSNDPHSWDTYDPCINSWRSLSDPNIIPDIEDSIVLGGKIYIRSGSSAGSSHVHAVVYEPSSCTWQHADANLVSGWRGPAVVVDGVLYVLDQSSGTRLMMWQEDTKEWVAVGRLSPLLTRPPCRLVAIDKSIYVIGKGLSTVVLNVSNVGNVGGVMLSSSVTKSTSDDDVISCKCMAI
ncbi:F-box/kelch-repeat protein SKIP4 isoform X3 [Diospyros lotus]|uniref:F-box/kelch-repeat protein SKIP4 isoform X3 n=1 Tax=Diospyros lotus TaxID=55363 RepID=UPI0022516D5F|nr:F-box/kelch-repeat protein SKIP4 isoform X3 [Diospyros lotus]